MRIFIMIAAALSLAALSGCATREPVPSSSVLPAATGETKVSLDRNGNTEVQLNVHHIAPPENLQPPKSTYVVWVEAPDKQLQNLGQLKIDKDREGKITGITTFRVFRLVVTAEDFPTVTQPSSEVVLTTGTLEAR